MEEATYKKRMYEKAKQIAQDYAKKHMVPAIKRQMISNNYVATGMFNELLYARAIKSTEYIVDVMFISAKKGSKFVQGEYHEIRTGLSSTQYTGMITPIKNWLEVRGIVFNKYNNSETGFSIGKQLTSEQAAWAIVNKYKKSGRQVPNERFITDLVMGQYKEGLIKAVEEGLMQMEIEI